MDNIFIHFQEGSGRERIIFANAGELSKERANKWGVGQMRLALHDGSILSIRERPFEVEKTLFQSYSFPLGSGDFRALFRNKSSMKSSRQLYDEIQRGERPAKWMRRMEIEFYSRFNTPLLCFVFALVGFSLGVQRMRGRSRGATLSALIIMGAYYSLFFAGVNLARSGAIPTYLAVFLPSRAGPRSGRVLF